LPQSTTEKEISGKKTKTDQFSLPNTRLHPKRTRKKELRKTLWRRPLGISEGKTNEERYALRTF